MLSGTLWFRKKLHRSLQQQVFSLKKPQNGKIIAKIRDDNTNNKHTTDHTHR